MMLDRRVTRGFLTGTAIVVAGAVIAGCGGSSDNSGKSVSLSRAAALSTAAPGYKLQITEQGSLGGHTFDSSGTGSFDAKDHSGSVDMTFSVAGQTLPLKAVFANGTVYERFPPQLTSHLPNGKPWLSFNLAALARYAKLPSMGSLMNSSSSGDPSQYLEYIRAAGKSAQNLGQETVAGVQTTHYRANLDLSKLPGTVPASERQAAQQLAAALKHRYKASFSPVDVWVDQADMVRKVQMSFNETAAGHDLALTLTEVISSYGAQPAPDIPAPSDTTDVLSLLHGGG